MDQNDLFWLAYAVFGLALFAYGLYLRKRANEEKRDNSGNRFH